MIEYPHYSNGFQIIEHFHVIEFEKVNGKHRIYSVIYFSENRGGSMRNNIPNKNFRQ